MEATRELLDEGSFHESTVEQVGERAGVSRATVYQYFPSRLELVDAICDAFAENPALLAVREAVDLPGVEEALDETIANSVRFWSSEDAILKQLYGATAVDPASRDLVERQLSDRRGGCSVWRGASRSRAGSAPGSTVQLPSSTCWC